MKVEARLAPLEHVKSYYDERIEGKIRDFTGANPRIEAAIQLLAEWAPVNPKRILEIGCGIGATSWRMARAWPQADVIGVDVSPASIEVANTCFQLPNLSYRTGLVKEGAFDGKFDLVLLMDVYEHIALEDRASIHAVIKALLSDESRVIVTVPTPSVLNYIRSTTPDDIQPVDEDVEPSDVIHLAEETRTQVIYYRQVGIWRYGDYAHIVLGRYKNLEDVALREYLPGVGIRQKVKNIIRGVKKVAKGSYDYLGSDMLRPTPRDPMESFLVNVEERHRIAELWLEEVRRKPAPTRGAH